MGEPDSSASSLSLASVAFFIVTLTEITDGFATDQLTHCLQTATLAEKAGVGMPEVAIFEGAPNAFATGAFKNSAMVAVSTGLLQGMTREEVLALERMRAGTCSTFSDEEVAELPPGIVGGCSFHSPLIGSKGLIVQSFAARNYAHGAEKNSEVVTDEPPASELA